MTKLSIQQKKDTYGGFGPMMLWISIVGACMVTSTLSNMVSSFSAGPNATTTTYYYDQQGRKIGEQTISSDSYSKNSGYMRVSPFPDRSAYLMYL